MHRHTANGAVTINVLFFFTIPWRDSRRGFVDVPWAKGAGTTSAWLAESRDLHARPG